MYDEKFNYTYFQLLPHHHVPVSAQQHLHFVPY